MPKLVKRSDGGGGQSLLMPGIGIAIIVLLALNLFKKPHLVPVPGPNPGPVPSPVNVARYAALERVVASANSDSVGHLGDLMLAAADLMERNPRDWKTSEVSGWLSAAETYRLKGTDLVGSVPGFTAEVNKLLAIAMGGNAETGADERALTPQEIAGVCGELRAIAKVCGVE